MSDPFSWVWLVLFGDNLFGMAWLVQSVQTNLPGLIYPDQFTQFNVARFNSSGLPSPVASAGCWALPALLHG